MEIARPAGVAGAWQQEHTFFTPQGKPKKEEKPNKVTSETGSSGNRKRDRDGEHAHNLLSKSLYIGGSA